MGVAQQMVHHFETLLALREVDTAHVLAAFELALRVVAKEGEDGDDAGRADVKRELVLEYGELLDVFGKALEQVGAVIVQLFCGLSVLGDSQILGCGLGERRSGCCRSSVLGDCSRPRARLASSGRGVVHGTGPSCTSCSGRTGSGTSDGPSRQGGGSEGNGGHGSW